LQVEIIKVETIKDCPVIEALAKYSHKPFHAVPEYQGSPCAKKIVVAK